MGLRLRENSVTLLIICIGCLSAATLLKGENVSPSAQAQLVEKERIVQVASRGGDWLDAEKGQELSVRERLRTGSLSRAAVKLTDLSVLRLNELTTIEIQPPEAASDRPVLDIKSGAMFMFSREKPRDLQIRTPVATGALRGTEFAVLVGANGRTTLTMFDGEVEVSNAQGRVTVRSGEQANVEPGRAPTKTAVIEATNIIQWCLYYPGVVDSKALRFTSSQKDALGASLNAYEAGDLLGALSAYPAGRQPSSPDERVYRAALLLSVGQVGKARLEMAGAGGANGTEALAQMIAAVKFETFTRKAPPKSASDWMAESYYQQSRSNLEAALSAARSAVQAAPSFGFAWARVANLEFSFGRTRESLEALETGLRLSPRNAQAMALRGFLLSAENKVNAAREAFDEAISLDGALGNAWLGRGLCNIRQGNATRGREDLQVAATLEPNRSILRSYLGKAFSNAGLDPKAMSEFTRAEALDPNDPTPWLYSALENKMENRINQAVDDLEKSVRLNDNRRVYRSKFLLDQDLAVRSANLATIYQAAGMDEVAVREATLAVTNDYSNASAHLFLANSYNNLRDPTRINLRYETPWYNELLLSFLLSPVGGGPISQYLSEQEYSKMFESDGLGLSTSTDYFSNGDLNVIASQYGTFGNISYSLDTQYLYSPGDQPNTKLSLSESSAQFKFQLRPEDTLFFRIEFLDNHFGDITDHYNPNDTIPDLHVTETETPGIVLLGYHHDWGPGVHTLLLVGRLADHIGLSQTRAEPLFIPTVPAILQTNFLTQYTSDFLVYTAELQQIFESNHNTLVAGARYQSGYFDTFDQLNVSNPAFAPLFAAPAATGNFRTNFERVTGYVYDTLKPAHWLSFTVGAAYDYLLYPVNYREPPIVGGSTSASRFSPKAGFTITPFSGTMLRGAYARSLGGASFDQSVLLEPTEIDGFPQVFRTVIPESIAGSVAAPRYEMAGIGLQQKFASKTYFGIDFVNIDEDVERQPGLFAQPVPLILGQPAFLPSTTSEKLSYNEKTLQVTLNQLVSNEWSLGLRDQLTYSELRDTFPDLPASVAPPQKQQALFNQLQLFANYNHPSGFFARAEATWFHQDNDGYTPSLPGDDFWQFNVFAGYRFRRNLGEISLGVLNLTDRDYRVNPLNSYYTPIDFYNSIPRERTLLVRVRLNF